MDAVNVVDIGEVPAGEIKRRIGDHLYERFDGEVQTGPFKGMKLLPERSWEDGNLSTQLLGCYEQELHQVIDREVARLKDVAEPKIVDIGCAEGYYAVGLARLLPHASVWICDISSEAIEITQKAAKANGVSVCWSNHLRQLFDNVALVVCDCEGSEFEYLDPVKYPSLLQASIIVELHDMSPERKLTHMLAQRFEATHEIWVVGETGRDPNQFEFMRPWHSTARWMAVSEGRPCYMDWLYLVLR